MREEAVQSKKASGVRVRLYLPEGKRLKSRALATDVRGSKV